MEKTIIYGVDKNTSTEAIKNGDLDYIVANAKYIESNDFVQGEKNDNLVYFVHKIEREKKKTDSLYELVKTLQEVYELDGELSEEDYKENLDMIKELIEGKSSSIIYAINSIKGEVDTLKKEIDRMSKLKKSKEKAVDRIKNYMLLCIKLSGGTEIKLPNGVIKIKKSKAVSILDEKLIPEKFFTENVVRNVSKKLITDAIKSGEIVQGAIITENENLEIK